MTTIPLTPLVAQLPASVPFVGPEAQERQRGQPFKARIGANESVFGPSPKAVAAMRAAAAEAWMYGDPEALELRQALARHHGVPTEAVMAGEGIDGLFGTAVRLFVEPGVAVVTSLGAYPTFNYHVTGFGGRLVTVPYRDDHEDPEALLETALVEGARLVFLANPDNPMASWVTAERVQRLLDGLPSDCLLLLDEAYGDFAPDAALPAMQIERPNLLRFRTFSKAHGLAGLRVGYVIGAPAVIDCFNKVRNHFGLGRVAQAGALAALQDQAYLRQVVAQVAEARAAIAAIAADNGLTALPSASNFVAVDCGGDGAFAGRVLAGLIDRGVFVRMPGVAPLNRCIRISAGRPADLAVLAEALPQALAEARARG
ncbi:MAG: pyridoxal phosphate-dependent aminotransferase [Rhodospirillales bacterium]